MRTATAIAALLACSACAQARADQERVLLYGYVQLMDNYIGRGLSQSVGSPSVQAEIDVNSGDGLYGNMSAVRVRWVDEVYAGASAHYEVDGVVGYRKTFGDAGEARFGVLQFAFPGRFLRGAQRPETTEAFGFVGWNGYSARFNYDLTDSFGTPDTRGAWYLDTNAAWLLTDAWAAAAHIGRKQSRGTDPATGADNAARFSYTDYKVSLTRLFEHRLSLTLALTWTSADPAVYTLDGYNVGGRQLSAVLQKDF